MKLALRSLLQSPGFTATAVVTLALGIGLNTAMFSLLNVFLLRPLPFPEPDRLFQVNRTTAQRQVDGHAFTTASELQRASADFAQVAAFRFWGFTLSEPNEPADIFSAHRVAPGYFDVLGVQPALGRLFRPEEDAPGANHVIVISHRFWQTRFKGDPDIIGRVVRLDGTATEIVGVLPASAEALTLYGTVWIYRPLGLTAEERSNPTDTSFRLIGRYHDGVTPAQAQARYDAMAAHLAAENPQENGDLALRVVSLQSTALRGSGRNLTYLLLGLSGFVLLIACANLANLLLARAISRAREFAIRSALGASRGQLIRPLAAECVLLGCAGAALGILVSIWTTGFMAQQLWGDGPAPTFSIDWRVLGFAFCGALGTAVLFGVAPALLISRVRVNDALKSGTRGSTHDRSHQRYRQLLIAGQFALALVLLAGAAAFVQGLDHLLQREAGWNPSALLTGKLAVPSTQSADPERNYRFYQEIRERLAALPGATNASVDVDLPLFGFPGPRNYVVEGRDPPPRGQEPAAYTNPVSPQYFATIGTRILRGRGVEATDGLGTPTVYVINQAMARALFPDGDAIGQRLGIAGQADPGWGEIVGIAEDVEFLFIGPEQTPFQVYKPLAQETWGYVSLTLRAATPAAAAALVEPFRRVVTELNPDLPVMSVMPVPALMKRATSDLRMINQLLIAFAALGLLLAALGIYSVIARTVVQRTSEIGIRIALGAQWRDIVRLILGGGMLIALVGTLVGIVAATGLTIFLTRTMPAIAGHSVSAIVAAVVVLFLVAMVACWLPARRAARVDPVVALRSE